MWATPASRGVLSADIMHTAATYTSHRHEKVVQWMDLRYIFDLIALETRFKRGYRRMKLWCNQKVLDEVLRAMLEEASWEELRSQRQRDTPQGVTESGRVSDTHPNPG